VPDARYRGPDPHNGHLLGIHPVADIDRTETHFIKIFFIWLSANTNILSCVWRFPGSNWLAKPHYLLLIVDSPRALWVPRLLGSAFAIHAWSSCSLTCSVVSHLHTCECGLRSLRWSCGKRSKSRQTSATWGPKLGFRQMCAARYTFGCVFYTSSYHDDRRHFDERPQILWRHASQPTPCHGRRRFLRPQLHTWRTGPC